MAVASACIALRYSVLYYTLKDVDGSTMGAFTQMGGFQPDRMPSFPVITEI